MTSNPASRSARATILAPRSWPSSPGLATSTRNFLPSVIPPLLWRETIPQTIGLVNSCLRPPSGSRPGIDRDLLHRQQGGQVAIFHAGDMSKPLDHLIKEVRVLAREGEMENSPALVNRGHGDK